MDFSPSFIQPKFQGKHSRLSRFGSAIILILFTIFFSGVALLVALIAFLFTGTTGPFWIPLLSFAIGLVVSVGLWRGSKWAFVIGALIAIGLSYKTFYPVGTITGLLLIFFIYWADRRNEEKIERYAFTILFLAFAIFTIILHIGEQSLPDFNSEGKKVIGVYDSEIRYWITARELKYHEACYLIDSQAFVEDFNAPKGEQIYFLRSRCIIDIALMTKNPSLCNQVVSAGKVKISGTARDGNKISADECRKMIESGGQLYVSDSLSNFNMAEDWEYYLNLLKRLGYTEQDISTFSGHTETLLTDGEKFYGNIKDTPEFRERLHNFQHS